MALFDLRDRGYNPPKLIVGDWDNFRRGLNLLLKETEIPKDAMAQADNIMLIGRGTPTKRWGLGTYYMANATGAVRGLAGYYKSDGTNELLAITDAGTLTVKSGASYIVRTGASWVSGYPVSMTQLNDNVYIATTQREVVKYDGSSLTGFPTVAQPTNVFATQISGASGTSRYSYRVNTITVNGDTLATTAFELDNQPESLTDGAVRISWTPASAASGVIEGYGIFGRNLGDERFISKVYAPETSFVDDGSLIPAEFTFPPLADSTGGIVAGNIERYDDRLIYSDIPGDESKMVITGRVPNHEKTDVASGGNYLRIEPDAGDPIKAVKGFGSRIIAFKEKSIWDVALSQLTVGNFVVTQPSATIITAALGCIAPKTIQAVEKDIFYLTRKGVYAIGYEPNILADVLRTNEISAVIRPYFENLTADQLRDAIAVYAGFKYIVIIPGLNQAVVYDRERFAWLGPWTFDANTALVYFDDNSRERYLLGSDDSPYVYELSNEYDSDNGSAINMTLRTKKEDFGDWSVYKTLKDVYSVWTNVEGEVTVELRVENREGQTQTIRSFTINSAQTQGSSGWGWDTFGTALWGDSSGNTTIAGFDELVKWLSVNKIARRVQIIIKTNKKGSNFELLGIQLQVRPIGRGLKGKGWRVTS